MRKIGLTLAAAFALAATCGGTASAKPPSVCDDMRPMMQQYQPFSGEVAEVIEQAGDAVCG